jgi:hypothetical protein
MFLIFYALSLLFLIISIFIFCIFFTFLKLPYEVGKYKKKFGNKLCL